jgi:hypothetical protein
MLYRAVLHGRKGKSHILHIYLGKASVQNPENIDESSDL